MRALAVISTYLSGAVLAACSPPMMNSVEVDTSGSPHVSGVVSLCGRETKLTRRGDSLRASLSVTCEGSGEVRLSSETGSEITCPIGYVTPGAEQKFSFALKDNECV